MHDLAHKARTMRRYIAWMADDQPAKYPIVPSKADIPAIEERVLQRWSDERTFESTVEAPAGGEPKGTFVFNDGPPFANGLPHYGHLLTGYVKDIIPRFQTMQGMRVERRFGWDCHGLPAEMQTEKELGVSGRKAIQKFGPPLHQRVGGLRNSPSPMGGLRTRLQDHGPPVHGVGHVGFQTTLRQGSALSS